MAEERIKNIIKPWYISNYERVAWMYHGRGDSVNWNLIFNRNQPKKGPWETELIRQCIQSMPLEQCAAGVSLAMNYLARELPKHPQVPLASGSMKRIRELLAAELAVWIQRSEILAARRDSILKYFPVIIPQVSQRSSIEGGTDRAPDGVSELL